MSFDTYNINDNNYFKLRDLAQTLRGTEKQFEVTWDGERNAINLISGAPYTTAGGEMVPGDGAGKTARPNASAIYLDGNPVTLGAYTINDNNYFKLRDIGKLFDFDVSWDGVNRIITIDTSRGYTEDTAGNSDASAEPLGGDFSTFAGTYRVDPVLIERYHLNRFYVNGSYQDCPDLILSKNGSITGGGAFSTMGASNLISPTDVPVSVEKVGSTYVCTLVDTEDIEQFYVLYPAGVPCDEGLFDLDGAQDLSKARLYYLSSWGPMGGGGYHVEFMYYTKVD